LSASKKSGLLKQSTLSRLLSEQKLRADEIMDDVPSRITIDGKPNRIFVELFNEKGATNLEKSLAKGSAEGDMFGVYADPANYWTGESEINFPIQIVSEQAGALSSREEIWTAPYSKDIDDIDDDFNAFIANLKSSLNYPIFAVTVEKEDDPSENDARKRKAMELRKGQTSPYLTFHAIRLYVTRDGLTGEEFLSWFGDGDLALDRYKHNDNGSDRTTDARGVDVKLEDVNTDHKWYEQDSTNLFYYMDLSEYSGSRKLILPFEDDINEGSMDRSVDCDWYGPGPNECYESENWNEAWNAGTGKVDKDIQLAYWVQNDQQGWVDTDDQYSEGALYNIDKDKILLRSSGGSIIIDTKPRDDGGLDDMRWKIGYAIY
jgi:hypothetical protein